MTVIHLICIIAAMLAIIVIGSLSGKRVKNASDFAFCSGKASLAVVLGSIVGGNVGSVATIGASQVAYEFGWAAMWYSIGAATGLLLTGFVLSPAYRRSGEETIQGLILSKYGKKVGTVIAVLALLCAWISPGVQLMAGRALWTRLLPIGDIAAILITVALVLVYVGFGGINGAGMLGVMKIGLLVLGIVSGISVVLHNDGWALLTSPVTKGIFSRGFLPGIAPGVSMMLGMLVNQSVFLAAISSKTQANMRVASGCAAFVALMMGLGSTVIGIFMADKRPGIPSDTVFVEFILHYLPPVLSGLVMAGLLTAILGTCASTAFTVSEMFVSDLYVRRLRKNASAREALWAMRIGIVVTLGGAVLFALLMNGSMLVDMNSITCASRAVLVLWPSLTALFMKQPPSPRVIVISSLLSILIYVVGYILWIDVVDPVYFSLVSDAAVIAVSCGLRNKKSAPQSARSA